MKRSVNGLFVFISQILWHSMEYSMVKGRHLLLLFQVKDYSLKTQSIPPSQTASMNVEQIT